MRGCKFQSKIFGLLLGILVIFGIVFRQSWLNFWDFFRTIWVEFSGLFWDSLDRIFRTVFGQSRTVLRFDFDPGTNFFFVYFPSRSRFGLG